VTAPDRVIEWSPAVRWLVSPMSRRSFLRPRECADSGARRVWVDGLFDPAGCGRADLCGGRPSKPRSSHARHAVACMIWCSSLLAAIRAATSNERPHRSGPSRSSGPRAGNYAPSHALSSLRHPRTEPVVLRPSPVSWSPAHPPAVPGPAPESAVASCVDLRRSASRLGVRSNRPSARDAHRPVRGTERHAVVASVPGIP
jgi:hypothetical protein